MINCFIGVLLFLTGPTMVIAKEGQLPVDQRAMMALDSGESDAVKELPASDQQVLKATLALKGGSPDRALDYLNHEKSDNDPLVALLEAEAHRQLAVLPVARARTYARGLQDEKENLENADLSSGLGEAEVRLNAFIDQLDGIYGSPLHLLRLGADIKSVFFGR